MQYSACMIVNLYLLIFLLFVQPTIEWASTEMFLSHRGETAKVKTAKQILKFVKVQTNIHFKFADSQCHGEPIVAQGLAQVEVIACNSSISKQHNIMYVHVPEIQLVNRSHKK